MYKVSKGIAPMFMKEVFPENLNILSGNVSANTRSRSTFYNPSNPKKVNSGLETLRSLGPKVWDMIPIELKSNPSLDVFKLKIKKMDTSQLSL